MAKIDVSAECFECGATGLYHGFIEKEGEYVVCATCGGTGRVVLSYSPFNGRRKRNKVKRVRTGSGSDSVKWMSYKEFLNLKAYYYY